MEVGETGNFQILSLSGGGMRGLYTVSVLAELEQTLADEHSDPDYWIGQHFDLICGTSVGGLLALGLASGLSARKLRMMLDTERLSIFKRKKSFTPKWVQQACNGLYSADPLKEVLANLFGDRTLGDLRTRVLVPAVNYTTGRVQVFKTPHHESFKRDWKLSMVDVALATSAAPTYFPIHQIGDCWYVDGGLAANSPALMGIHEARHFLDKTPDQIRIMLVGTMGLQKTANQSSKRERGYFSWGFGRDLIDLTLSANEDLHNQIGSHLIPPDRLLELDDSQTPDQSSILALDNASNEAAETLRGRGSMRAQMALKEPIYCQIVKQKAPTPEFYYGPNKNV